MQSTLRHGSDYGFWETPQEWAPGQTGQATLRIDLRGRILEFLRKSSTVETEGDSDGETNQVGVSNWAVNPAFHRKLVEQAVRLITRYCILLRIAPVTFKRVKGGPLDVTTIRSLAYTELPRLMAACIANIMKNGPDIAGYEAPDALIFENDTRFLNHIPKDFYLTLARSVRDAMTNEVRRMEMLSKMGLWNDAPPVMDDVSATMEVAGPSAVSEQEVLVTPHLPLPDEYVSLMGTRSLWLIEVMGPAVIPVLKELKTILQGKDETESSGDEKRACAKAFVAGHVWMESEGTIIDALPFSIYSPNFGGRYNSDTAAVNYDAHLHPLNRLDWPPKEIRQVFELAYAVQYAHIFVVGLAMAARRSELLTLERTCIRYARNGTTYVDGRTFKLVERHDGKVRDWILPAVAATAIEQQIQLISVLETIGNYSTDDDNVEFSEPIRNAKHLWARTGHGSGDRSEPLVDLNHALKQYARILCMDPEPSGQPIRPHRLRKTVARLVALALIQAPRILMAVFGHKSIEMTMSYMLSDKNLRAEIEKVARELRVIRAADVVLDIVYAEDKEDAELVNGGYGGPAAHTIKHAQQVFRERLHQTGDDFDARTLAELAELLTLRGKAWVYVRPGIICTKFPGTESGPCNKSRGQPEPARCQTHCSHRLEEQFLRRDVDAAIAHAVDEYVRMDEEKNELVQGSWASQIMLHLGRFEDVRQKWMLNPIVQRVFFDFHEESRVSP